MPFYVLFYTQNKLKFCKGICVEYFPVGFLLFLCPVLWPVDVYLIGSTARFGGFSYCFMGGDEDSQKTAIQIK